MENLEALEPGMHQHASTPILLCTLSDVGDLQTT